jgi:hypothetical protein
MSKLILTVGLGLASLIGTGACVAGTASGQGGEHAGKSSSQHPSQFASVLIPEDQQALLDAGFTYFRAHVKREDSVYDAQLQVSSGRAQEFRIIQGVDGLWMEWLR